MVTLATRIILLVIFTTIGILLMRKGDSSAWFYFSVDILIFLEYLRGGSMWPAYQAFKLQDYKVLKRRLRETVFPALLGQTHKAKYFYLRGVSELHGENFELAEKYLQRALKQKKTSKTDRGMIYGFLASIALQQKDRKSAETYLAKAEKEGDSPALRQMSASIQKKLDN